MTSAPRRIGKLFLVVIAILAFEHTTLPQNKYEGRRINSVIIEFTGSETQTSIAEQFRIEAAEQLGDKFSTVGIRNAIAKLHESKRVVSVVVESIERSPYLLDLRILIKRATQAERVNVEIGNTVGNKVTEQEILFKLNLLNPGTPITEQTLQNNADVILEYLRDRGFFNAEVTFTQRALDRENQIGVTFNVKPNDQARVGTFEIDIEGFEKAMLTGKVKLKPGELYSRELLSQDVERIKRILRENDFLAPELNEPRPEREVDSNTINIKLTGRVGPKVTVTVETEDEKVSGGTQERLLPVKRDGTLHYAAIVEGERRLENYFQEQGYFFANVTPVCSVEPPFVEGEATTVANDTEFLCSALGGADLFSRTVEVKYKVTLDRKLRLSKIRIRGTDELPIEELRTILDTQEANIFGIIPLFGYGRGYTSETILEDDALTIKSLMRELGYRDAEVRYGRGVSLDGEELVITFYVEEGVPTVVNGVEIAGNSAFDDDTLLGKLPLIIGKNYSRARIRNAERKLAEFYSEEGYFDARISSSITERTDDPTTKHKLVKIGFTVETEGKKVVIDRVLVTGNDDTRTNAILRAVTLQPNELLKRTDVYKSEQNLYATDAFERVEIRPEPARDRSDGTRSADVIIGVKEQAPRLMQYGGGYSTDLGLSGFFDIRHYNLFGRLWQGGARIRWSQRQQLVQFDYVNPRFIRDGTDRFAPLTLTAQFQRDSTVTRFFRSAFDKGTFGIVQRVDENGVPIDIFGVPAGDPTINRLTLTAETNRTINIKDRSVLFFRYRFEDVRLNNIESLLIKDLLRPDDRIRISGFGATFVRDRRERCATEYSLLEVIARGEPGNRCRYNASDPTNGDYLTAEYNVSVPFLGANIGFHKFQASYNYYYTFPQLKNTTFAGRAILGLAHVFAEGNRFPPDQFEDLNGILPISERFFAGGSNTLRGFDFEEAGPRVVVIPEGEFRNSSGEPVILDPFSVPFGGNAIAIVNLEARIPLSKSIRAVPFYDGGNVFRRIGDIFNPPDVPADDVFKQNLRALWTHTVGVGLRLKTPFGGEFGVDYGYLLNPPRFLIPQKNGPNGIHQLHQGQIHFRFSQAF